MLLRQLKLRHLRRIETLDLDFRNADGSPRGWTVLIGRNGTAKTTILQAIALATAGAFRADSLIDDIRESLPDKRTEPGRRPESRPVGGQEVAPADIEADFTFGPVGQDWEPAHPMLAPDRRALLRAPEYRLWLRSRLKIRASAGIEGASEYVSEGDEGPKGRGDEATDPLMVARERNLATWFVAGYGVDRHLSQASPAPVPPARPSIDRIRPLFERRDLLGLNFAGVLEEKLSQRYASLLKAVLFRTDRTESLVPGLSDLELRGRRSGGPNDLMLAHRFEQRVNGNDLKLPATWLSHGYQSVLAWVSDLVGQITLEAGMVLDPEEMEGLVLIDEVDLYLHPSWQVGLIQALRETFPQMQFVVTTHSPILLTAFRPEEVVVLDFDERGNVVRTATPKDPRLMTATELYEWFFGIDKLYPSQLGEKLDAYSHLAANPLRSDEEHEMAKKLFADLKSEGISPGLPLSPRARAVGA